MVSFTWPLTVAGCLASEEEQPFFEGKFRDGGRAGMAFGNSAQTLAVLKRCWYLSPDVNLPSPTNKCDTGNSDETAKEKMSASSTGGERVKISESEYFLFNVHTLYIPVNTTKFQLRCCISTPGSSL